MLTLSLESGFKNSGVTLGKRDKFVVATRSSHGLEIPLTDDRGQLLVDKKYVDFVVSLANEKLKQNEEKHLKLKENFNERYGK